MVPVDSYCVLQFDPRGDAERFHLVEQELERVGHLHLVNVCFFLTVRTVHPPLLDESDRELINVCGECGMTAVENVEQRRVYCPNCEEETDIHEVEMSYAFKLLLDEMKALGIAPRIELEDAV